MLHILCVRRSCVSRLPDSVFFPSSFDMDIITPNYVYDVYLENKELGK